MAIKHDQMDSQVISKLLDQSKKLHSIDAYFDGKDSEQLLREMLQLFITKATFEYLNRDQLVGLSEDALTMNIVVAKALQRLVKLRGAEAALGMKPKAPGKRHDPSEYLGDSRIVDVLLRKRAGSLDKKQAIAKLGLISVDFTNLDARTIDQLLVRMGKALDKLFATVSLMGVDSPQSKLSPEAVALMAQGATSKAKTLQTKKARSPKEKK